MPEDVKAMRPRSAFDVCSIHRRIEHGISNEIRIARTSVQLAEDEIRIRGVPGNLPMPLKNTKQRLRQMLHEFSLGLGRVHEPASPHRLADHELSTDPIGIRPLQRQQFTDPQIRQRQANEERLPVDRHIIENRESAPRSMPASS